MNRIRGIHKTRRRHSPPLRRFRSQVRHRRGFDGCALKTFFGRTTASRAEITEPEPGRVLVETIPEASLVTTFVVEPGANPAESVVTIRTEMPVRGGMAGTIEKFLTTRLLRPVYAQELRLLEEAAAGPAQTEASATSRA